MSKKKALLYSWITALLGLILWEGYVSFLQALDNSFFIVLPSPSMIMEALISRWDLLYGHATYTFMAMLFSIALALFASIPLGWAMASSEFASTLFQGSFLALQSIPTFCLSPILVIWFGWGRVPACVPAFLAALLPLTISVFRGISMQSKSASEYFTFMKATPWQRLIKLHIPTMLPSLFSGLRIAIAGSGMATVAGEWCGAKKGLGILLMEMREQMDVPMMFACIVMISCVSAVLYGVSFLSEFFLSPRCIRAFSRAKASFSKASFIKQALFSIFICLFCAAGCSPGNSAPREGSHKIPICLMLDWTPCPTHIPIYHGMQEGYFGEEGFDLSLIRPGSVDALQIVATSASVDAVLSHLPRVIRLSAIHGFDLQVIGTLIQDPLNGFLARRDTVPDIAAMQGKRVGFSGSKFSSSTLDVLLAQKGVNIGEKHNVHMDLLSQLAVKNVDIIWGAFSSIEPFQLQAFGIEPKFFSVCEFGMPTYHELVVVSSKKGKFKNFEYIARFQRALQKSIDDAKARPQKALQNYFLAHPEKGKVAVAWEEKAWGEVALHLSECQKISRTEIAEPLAQWLIDHHILSSKPDLHGLVRYVDDCEIINADEKASSLCQ